MSKRQWLIVLGVWVMVFLFLGFPSAWNKILAVASGLFIVIGAYRLGDMSMATEEREMPYVEHKGEAPVMKDMKEEKEITNTNSPQS